MSAEDSDTETDAPAPVPIPGETVLQHQLDAIAAERGLDRSQVLAGQQLGNMPSVTPAAFAAIAGILDALIDADAHADTQASTEQDGT